MSDLDKILEVFDLNLECLQSVSQIKRKLEAHGKSWKDFENWVAEKVKQKASVNMPVLYRKCPECGTLLKLRRVNNGKPDLCVPGAFQCQWYCPRGYKCGKGLSKGEVCGWEEFSVKPIEDEARPYLKEI